MFSQLNLVSPQEIILRPWYQRMTNLPQHGCWSDGAPQGSAEAQAQIALPSGTPRGSGQLCSWRADWSWRRNTEPAENQEEAHIEGPASG